MRSKRFLFAVLEGLSDYLAHDNEQMNEYIKITLHTKKPGWSAFNVTSFLQTILLNICFQIWNRRFTLDTVIRCADQQHKTKAVGENGVSALYNQYCAMLNRACVARKIYSAFAHMIMCKLKCAVLCCVEQGKCCMKDVF